MLMRQPKSDVEVALADARVKRADADASRVEVDAIVALLSEGVEHTRPLTADAEVRPSGFLHVPFPLSETVLREVRERWLARDKRIVVLPPDE